MNWQKLTAILIGILGVLLVILGRGEIAIGSETFMLGVLFLILCNINSGFSNVLIAKRTQNIPPLILSSSSLIIGGIILFIVSVPMEGIKNTAKPVEYYWALFWLSFISAASISIWTALLKRPNVKVSDLNMWKFIVPVFGAILSWILLQNESPNMLSVLGMVLTATALLLVNYFNRKKYKS